MANYIEKAEGKDFLDLLDDQDFQTDLYRFFASGRYNMTIDEMREEGAENLARKFVEHMRFQDTNEATAAKDYFFVKDRENNREEDLAAFGRLMSAWDTSEGGGTGFLTGAGDYAQAILTSPSTWITVGTAGLGGPISKITSGAAKKGTQLAARAALADLVRKGIAAETVKGGLKTAAVKGAIAGAAVEGGLSAYQVGTQMATREEVVPEYEPSAVDFGLAVGASAALGGVLGGAARRLDVKRQNAVIDTLYEQAKKQVTSQADATISSLKKIKEADPKKVDKVINRIVDMSLALSEKSDYINLTALPKDKVDLGRTLRESIFKTDMDQQITANLSTTTLKQITAATLDVIDTLDIQEGERISSAVMRGIESGKINVDEIRNAYGLTRDQFSYIYLSDISDAARALQEASKLKKATLKGQTQNDLDGILKNIQSLADRKVSTLGEAEAAEFAKKLQDPGLGIVNFAREADALRISFMTSQLATTAANVVFSTARLGVDASDQIFRNLISGGQSVLKGEMPVNPMSGVFDMVKGLSWGKQQAELARLMLAEDLPEAAKNVFYDTVRAENATGSQTLMAKTGRAVNFLNDATDAIFKQAAFYASLNRSLTELGNETLGKSFAEFAAKNSSLDFLPKEILERATNDALDFTFQKTYRGDRTLFGQAARGVINAHKKIPFIVSSQIPFPRYIANHLEFIHDYTPIGFATAAWDKYVRAIGDPFKDTETRMIRGFTGLSMLAGAYFFRASQGGETAYNQYIDEEGNTKNLERVAGPWNAHLLMADLLYRWKNDLPLPGAEETISNMLDVTVGLGELGYNQSTFEAVAEGIEKGSLQPMQKVLSDLAATFTYPTAVVRDLVGQHSPLASYSDYTKNANGDTNLLDSLGMVGEEFINRSTRFLPDFDMIQYTQSYNGKNDIPLYKFSNPRPVGSINPFMKQVTGVDTQAPLTELEKELNRLNLKDWKIYRTTTVANPTIDVVVRERLAKTLYKEFESWRSVKQKAFGGLSYDELDRISDKERELKSWINKRRQEEEAIVEDVFTKLVTKKPRAAVGFVRNMYEIKKKDFVSATNDKNIYDTAVYVGTGGKYSTADEYLTDGLNENIATEVERRMLIMKWARGMVPAQ